MRIRVVQGRRAMRLGARPAIHRPVCQDYLQFTSDNSREVVDIRLRRMSCNGNRPRIELKFDRLEGGVNQHVQRKKQGPAALSGRLALFFHSTSGSA